MKWRTAAVLASAALLTAACGSDPGQGAGEPPEIGATTQTEAGDGAAGDLSGTIAIDGSSTVEPLTAAIAEEFRAEAPDVSVNVTASGTGGGFERFCGVGDTEISNASRPIKEEEAALCTDNGIEYIEVRVGTDALTMVTNPETDFVECLTTEEVQAIWAAPGASRWNEVRSEFPNEEIAIFAPGADSGTYDFFNETVLGEGQEPIQQYNASEDDNIIAQGIIGTPGSWGYFGYAFFVNNQEQLKALAYDAGDGCVPPSPEAAQDDSYKLARPLFIYVKQSALQDPAVAEFVTFYLENVNAVIEDVGYIPATDETIAEAQQKVEDAIAAAG